MRIVTKRHWSFVTVLSLFFMITIITPTQVSAVDVGLSVAGPLVGAEFSVVSGSRISSTLSLRNQGDFPSNLTSYTRIFSGIPGSIGVKASLPAFVDVLPKDTRQVNYDFTVMDNASGVVSVTIGWIATTPLGNGSIAFAGIETTTTFIIDPYALFLRVRVVDQWDWPIDDLTVSVSLVRGTLEYVRQYLNTTGETSFLISRGLYKLRLFEGDVLRDSATLNITSDRLFEFVVQRTRTYLTPVPTFGIELGLGVVIGYLYRFWTTRKKKTKSEFEKNLEWCKEKLT